MLWALTLLIMQAFTVQLYSLQIDLAIVATLLVFVKSYQMLGDIVVILFMIPPLELKKKQFWLTKRLISRITFLSDIFWMFNEFETAKKAQAFKADRIKQTEWEKKYEELLRDFVNHLKKL